MPYNSLHPSYLTVNCAMKTQSTLLACLIAATFSFTAASPDSVYAQSAAVLPVGFIQGASVEGISEIQLQNGLRVLLIPDASKPTVTINLTVQVGSRHENYGETGMAHLLEHMLFKGTPKYPKAWAEFTKRGMRSNGSTWTDRTNYFASFAYDEANVDWYVRWLADALINSTIAKADLDSEMTVVRNEMESGENDPFRVVIQGMLGAAYQWHNYGKSTIGARADVENVDIERLRAFYKTYYQPDNSVLIISGKFDQPKILALLADSFGKIPKSAKKLPVFNTIDPVQNGERTFTVRRPGGTPLLMAGYHIPAGGSKDTAAMALVEDILGDAPSGRLHQNLVEKKLASSAFGFGFRFKEPSYGFFGAQLPANTAIEPTRAALLETVESIAKKPFTAQELERAKTRWLKNWELAYTDPERVGVSLSEAIAIGDWRMFFVRRDQVKAVTLADVQRVATQYLLPDNRTLGLYEPTEKPLRAPQPKMVDIAADVKDYKGNAVMAAGEAFDATPANIQARTQISNAGGVKLALLPKATRGQVVVGRIQLQMGTVESLKGLRAVGETMAAQLNKGTTTLSRNQIQERFDNLKANVAFQGGASGLGVQFKTTRENLAPTLDLIVDVLRNANFPESQLQEYKSAAITAIRNAEKEPDSIVRNSLSRHTNPYPADDIRYAPSFEESVKELDKIKVEDLRAFHRRFVAATNAQVSIVGDFDAPATKSKLDNLLGGWKGSEPTQRISNPFVPTKAGNLKFETPDKQNAYFGVATSFALKQFDADHAALTVANQIFGAGQNSRLWNRIREKDGLSYGVGASLSVSAYEPSGSWRAGGIYAPDVLSKFRTAFDEELNRALKEGFTDIETTQAKEALIRSRDLSRAQDDSVTGSWIFFLDIGWTFEKSAEFDRLIKSVTAKQASDAFKKYIQPTLLVYGVGGDFAKVGQ
jgi:zinc protease